MANSGKTLTLTKILTIAFSQASVDPRISWILDSCATDHMTPIDSLFTSYIHCGSNRRVQIVDETCLVVAGIGTINLEPVGKLEHELHVPKLFISLVSV